MTPVPAMLAKVELKMTVHSRTGHTVTQLRNRNLEHWRGLSRGYAVTRPPKCVRVCVREEGIGGISVSLLERCVTA